MEKLPPIEKFYEAYSAIADGRVHMEDTWATVQSSDRSKEYYVSWDDDVYGSTDSATVWQGYPGYPILAVLMLQGRIPFEDKDVRLFAGINWTLLNKEMKRDYAKAVEIVFKDMQCPEAEKLGIQERVRLSYAYLVDMTLYVTRGKAPKKEQVEQSLQ